MIRRFPFIICFLLLTLVATSQKNVEEIVGEGVRLHDEGKYEEAIKIYEKALDIDDKSSIVNYEIAYSLIALKEYKKAIKHLDVVIKNNAGSLREAYSSKGSAQDIMGKPKAAVKTFEKAIKLFPDDYLLYYNLGITNNGMGNKAEAMENFEMALSKNINHTSSHYVLGLLKADEGDRIESLLSLYFFLLLEPNSSRSKNTFKVIEQQMGAGVSKESDTQININMNADKLGSEFSGVDIILSLSAAKIVTEEKEGSEVFKEMSKSFLGALPKPDEAKTGVYWNFYIPLYDKVRAEEYIDTFLNYISVSQYESSMKWVEENEEKMDALAKLVNGE